MEDRDREAIARLPVDEQLARLAEENERRFEEIQALSNALEALAAVLKAPTQRPR